MSISKRNDQDTLPDSTVLNAAEKSDDQESKLLNPENCSTMISSTTAEPQENSALIPENCTKVCLHRGPLGYGFSIIGGVDQPYLDNDSGIFITRIARKGTAAKNGNLAVGDKIISINGNSCEGKKHHDVLDMFHSSPVKVDLVIWAGAEALVRQELMAKQEQTVKNKVTVKGTLWFITKSSIFAGAVYYVLKKFEIINSRGKLLVPAKEAPKKFVSELLSFSTKYIPKLPIKSIKN